MATNQDVGLGTRDGEIEQMELGTEKKCSRCRHDCHCDNVVCDGPVGVGVTDKTQPCGCGVCECDPPKRPDWG